MLIDVVSNSDFDEARAALVGLGYSPEEADRIVDIVCGIASGAVDEPDPHHGRLADPQVAPGMAPKPIEPLQR
jgi:hypothetical protein